MQEVVMHKIKSYRFVVYQLNLRNIIRFFNWSDNCEFLYVSISLLELKNLDSFRYSFFIVLHSHDDLLLSKAKYFQKIS